MFKFKSVHFILFIIAFVFSCQVDDETNEDFSDDKATGSSNAGSTYRIQTAAFKSAFYDTLPDTVIQLSTTNYYTHATGLKLWDSVWKCSFIDNRFSFVDTMPDPQNRWWLDEFTCGYFLDDTIINRYGYHQWNVVLEGNPDSANFALFDNTNSESYMVRLDILDTFPDLTGSPFDGNVYNITNKNSLIDVYVTVPGIVNNVKANAGNVTINSLTNTTIDVDYEVFISPRSIKGSYSGSITKK